jgi:rRNA-processing protein FCF1/DNA polymerase III delta prime subunit
MKYTREEYVRFLCTELEAQEKSYEQIVKTKATVLKDNGEVFVGMFQRINEAGFAVFKVRNSENMPRKNSFWSAVYLNGEMGKFRNWGDLSWNKLREEYQRDFSDCLCAWISKSDDDAFCLVGIKNLTIQFTELLEQGKTIIAFGPKDPPLQYLLNLIQIVKDGQNRETQPILDFSETEDQWNPKKIEAKEDLVSILLNNHSNEKCVVVQGPPGTGKTTRMAQLAAKLLKENKSVLVTALTNQALIELAKKDKLQEYIERGKVSKTSLTVDEKREQPHLQEIKENKCNASSGFLSLATFYLSSGWAVDITDIPFDYVIMDEASQALLPMIAASMKLGRKVILIGDQKQLPPIVLTNEDLINRFNWSNIIKGFQTICSYFSFNSFMLSDTYRMTARGAECTGAFYNNELRSVSEIQEVVTSIADLDPKGGAVIKELEMKVGDKNPQNAFEYIYALTKSILLENSKADIAILSKFRETTRQLQKNFTLRWDGKDYPDNIKIDTIDRVQGLTVHFCFFLIPNASIRYSLEPELFNVATSRAMNNTIIVLPTTLYKELIPEEVKNYLIKAKQGCEKSANSHQKVISSGNVQVKVIDKIDLSKFETPKQKAVKSSTKRNVYIIDTNVFVNYPDIISKIDEKYLVVLSAKVIDELDKLKIKLDATGKLNVEKALRNINRAMDKRNIRMELSDVELLPDDFNKKSPDNNILTVALKYKNDNPILLTSDNGLQVKAKGLGISTISLRDFLKR